MMITGRALRAEVIQVATEYSSPSNQVVFTSNLLYYDIWGDIRCLNGGSKSENIFNDYYIVNK